jgi:hypothetical protein
MMSEAPFSQINRRDFLRSGAVGAAGLALAVGVSPLLAQAGGLNSEHVATLEFALTSPQVIGVTPDGMRQIFYVREGRASGPKLNGTFLAGGGDWLRVRSDGVFMLDVRTTLQLDDGAYALLSFLGYSVMSQEVFSRIADGEDVDPSEYYARTTPRFETASSQYAWLNHTIFVGTGRLGARLETVAYDIYQIL